MDKNELFESLYRDLLSKWFPACLTSDAGFSQNFTHDWVNEDQGIRSLVFQTRMIWVTAKIADSKLPYASEFREYCQSGFSFLIERFFNQESGAFLWCVDSDGNPVGEHKDQIHAYGMSFAIYALAAATKTFGPNNALPAAKLAFEWLERNHYDPEFGGYFECTTLEGQPILVPPSEALEVRGDAIDTRYGLKSQNTHLHLLEAFAELYRVWPDERLRVRLVELLEILTVRLWVEPGWLHLFTERDWTPIEGGVSFGHDIEAAHLILDAADVLGITQNYLEKAKQLADYCLDFGWRPDGGFYYAGDSSGKPTDTTMNWWAQAEGLLGLSRLAKEFPSERYAQMAEKQWEWIKNYQIDSQNGGWYESVSPNGEPLPPTAKGHQWKAAYHDGRSLLYTARLLGSEA